MSVKKLRVAFGADHAGIEMKNDLVLRLKTTCRTVDLGAYTYDNQDDYPDYAAAVAKAVAGGQADRGIIVCGSGVGACVTANKIAGVRAGICHDTYSARQGVEHDDMNVLCLGSRVIGIELAVELAGSFLGARFRDEERFRRRLDKVLAIEREAYGQRHASRKTIKAER